MSTIFIWTGKGGPNWDSTSGTITNWQIPGGTNTIVASSDTSLQAVAVFNDGGIHSVGGAGGADADQIALQNDTTVTLTDNRFRAGAFLPENNAGFPDDLTVEEGSKLIIASGAGMQNSGTVSVIGIGAGLLGVSGTAIMEVDPGGLFTAEDLIIGDSTDDVGVVTADGALEFDIVHDSTVGAGRLTVGYSGTGSLKITNTAAFFTESAVLGLNQGAVGSLSLASSTWGAGGVTLGAAGTGHMTIAAGATVALYSLIIGAAQTGSGDLLVNGASFGVDFLTIGMDGTGTATFGANSIGTFATVTVGDNATAISNLTLDGATWNTSTLTIGLNGAGHATAGNGEIITASNAILGSAADVSGDLTLDNAILNGGTVVIGLDGTGDLSILSGSGGTVAAVILGEDTGSSGTLTIDGADWNVGSLTVGLSGDGQATVGAGAIATLDNIFIGPTGNLAVNQAAGSVGSVIAQQVSIDFGTLDLTGGGRVLIGAAAGANGAVAIGSKSSLTGLGSLKADVLLSGGGLVEATGPAPGALTIDGNVSGAGSIEPVITLEVNGNIGAGVDITFGPSIGANVGDLILDVPGGDKGTIVGFGDGNTIDIQGSVYDTAVFTQGTSGAAGTLTLSGGTVAPLSLLVAGTYAVGDFIATPGATDTVVTLCFTAGTRISTPCDEVPVEQLSVGDEVLTFSGATRRITWIGKGQVLATRGQRSAATPVIVCKGALVSNVPDRDLRLTKGHALYIDDVLIPVEELINHRSILWDDRAQEVELYHVELDSHDVLIANGAPAESYRDDGNRWLFQNANSGWNLPPQEPCAPLVTDGPVVDTIWRRLLDRSGPRPGFPLTPDPDLRLIVDGDPLVPISSGADWYKFHLPTPASDVRIVSRAAVPQELGLARDPRLLGVAIRRIVAVQASRRQGIGADDARLNEGFHTFEAGNNLRWTNGNAVIPPSLFDGYIGIVELILHLGATTGYIDEGISISAA
jgi:hypothetical protein